eukprot:IDg21606t1
MSPSNLESPNEVRLLCGIVLVISRNPGAGWLNFVLLISSPVTPLRATRFNRADGVERLCRTAISVQTLFMLPESGSEKVELHTTCRLKSSVNVVAHWT